MGILDFHIKKIFGEDEIPETKADYDANGNCIYQGFAKPGTDTSARAWIIVKNSYDSNFQWTGAQVARVAIWDNRASTF